VKTKSMLDHYELTVMHLDRLDKFYQKVNSCNK